MLKQLFPDNLLTTFLCIICLNLWLLYYLHINAATLPAIQSTDVKKPKGIDLAKDMKSTFIGSVTVWFVLISIVLVTHVNVCYMLYDSVYLSNNSVTYFYIIILLLFLILYIGVGLFTQNISFSIEYILFIVLIFIGAYLLISSANLFLSAFLLELLALLIFGKLAISRITVKKNSLSKQFLTQKIQYSYGLFNTLFFQFWANFASSIFLFFALLNIHHLCGTSNFLLINFLFFIFNSATHLPHTFISTTLIILVTGLFIKLGLAPYQFFKIEVYKGVPVFIIIIYTAVYLIVYIYFFLFLFTTQLSLLREFVGIYVSFLIVISILYLTSLLFDTKNFKAFLSYSTLLTVSNLFVLILTT